MRFFVNTQHPLYREIAKANASPQLWLGDPSDVETPEIGDSLGRNAGEIFFYSEDLLDRRRKLQVIFDSFVNPRIFIDGALNEKEVERLLKAEVEAARVSGLSDQQTLNSVATGTILGTGGAIGGAAIGGTSIGTTVIAGGVKFATFGAKAGTAVAPIIGTAIGAIVGVVGGIIYGKHARAGAEDDLAPWLMTRADFPWTTGQAIKGQSNIRSLKRLYDDRKRLTRDFPNDRAIALLLNSTFADALFGNSKNHPDPRTDDRDLGSRREGTLKAYFGFNQRGGVNQTYVDAILRIGKYLFLIDEILKFDDETLSRAIDVTEVTLPSSPINISLTTYKVRLYGTLQTAAEQVITEKVFTYMNPEREYKTLLNAGNDRQYVMESWRLSPSTPNAMQFKLLNPLDTSIRINDNIYVSRELAKSVIDVIDFQDGPEVDITPYLRPRNTNVGIYAQTKQLRDVTLSNLGLSDGSEGFVSDDAISYEDTIFRRWYTADFNSSELNIDFTKYDNFVQYGSAESRLISFYNKLQKIESLTNQIKGSTVLDQQYAQEKESIIRNFDSYEQYLFYVTASVYSASAFYADNDVEYNPTGSWPKQTNGQVYPTTSSIVEEWYVTQSNIARRYDEFNQNYLVKHLPSHVQEDVESSEFLVFVGMFGHVMDNLKEYIDQFPNIYSTNLDPYKDLTMDQVYEVATSFGFNLPNVYSLNSLQEYFATIFGEQGSRSLVAETWKRFLHSMAFIYKSKGTKTSLETILSTYGIRTPMLQIKESSYPSADNYINSEEFTYGLKFTSATTNRIRLPLVSSSVATNALTVRFRPTVRQSSSILSGDDKWAVNLRVHPSASKINYGRVEIISGSNNVLIASSSYFRLFDTDYTLLALRSQSADITIIQSDGSQILYEYSASSNIPSSLWNTTTYAYVGGSGSIKLNTNFEGIVDEIRTWSENISSTNIIRQAYDPGAAYGQSYSSSYAILYTSLTFSTVSASVTTSLDNEAQYYSTTTIPTIPLSGFTTASYIRLSRDIKQFLPVIGASIYSNNKIKVAPPPVFSTLFVDETTGTITLDPRRSIKSINDKIYTSGLNTVNFGVSPTDYINQDIIRKIGVVDINTSVGNNRDLKDGKYDQLDTLFKYYLKNYYKPVNVNEFIDFYSNLAQAPAESAQWLAPARARLLTGIIIESPILSRKKLLLSRGIAVGGSNTKALDSYSSGSTIVNFGVYAGDTEINVSSEVQPNADYTTHFGNLEVSLVTPSSSNQYFEANLIEATPIGTASAGYARHAFLDELEENPVLPLYSIPPRSDLSDYGVTTYFHKKNGIYEFIGLTPFKQYYLAKLDVSPTTTISPLYSKIALLPTSSTAAGPGRFNSVTTTLELSPNQTKAGLLNVANIFSLLGVVAASGSRIRIYKTKEQRDIESEISRSYFVPPTIGDGVLFDAILNGISDVNPPVLIQTDNSSIYYRIDNTNTSKIFTSITFSYFAYEPIDSIPYGYLPRHYRFSRDNTTPLKRRNYVGCKATIVDKVSDPLGKIGTDRPFFNSTAEPNSIDVFRPTGGPPPTTPAQPYVPGQPIGFGRGPDAAITSAPTPITGPSGRPRLTSILGRIFGRNGNR